jgi:hypothetical protein
MKKLLLFSVAIFFVFGLQAQQDSAKVKKQDTNVVTVEKDSTVTKVKVSETNLVTVEEDSVATRVKVGKNGGIQVIANHEGDTVHIRVGNRIFDVIDNGNSTEITTSKEPKENRKHYRDFNGHWGGFELGVNTFRATDYSLYNNTGYGEFFDLNYSKSLTFNLNIAEFAFSNNRKTIGVLTGAGFSFMNFRFDQAKITVEKNSEGLLIPVTLESAKKSKLNLNYLTIPLILEVNTPLKLNNQHLSLAAGVIGGLNIGNHTKIKYDDNSKEKVRGNFNVNPFKYELTGRLGLGEFCLFANYSMTPLFKEGKGPELYPLVVGISFPNINF